MFFYITLLAKLLMPAKTTHKSTKVNLVVTYYV